MAEHDAKDSQGAEGESVDARALGSASERSSGWQERHPSHAEHVAGPLELLAALHEVAPCELFRVVERFLGAERRPPRCP